ncbi:MAG TPA: hypothetical protein VGE61_00540 [Glycomyces sp.]
MDSNRPDDTSRKPDKDDKKPRPSGRPAEDDDSGAATFGVSFGVGAPQPDSGAAGPDVNVPSGEAASLGLDPDHGVTGNIPFADAQIPVPVGDQVVPVKAVLGLTLKGWAAIGGVVLAGLIGVSVANADGDPGPGTATASETDDFGVETTDDWDTWDDEETTDYVDAVPDPVADAAVGDCFFVSGDISAVEVDIESTYCGAGAFEVIDIVEGTNDLSACDADAYSDQSVTSTVTARVLCMAYIPIDGDTAYRAQTGECVYGPNDYSSAWTTTSCDTGSFRVIERYEGQSDPNACANDGYGDRSRTYAAADSYFDVTLCLQIVYPDDIGYAEQYTCMVLYEDDTFRYADSCDTANVRVVGRTSDYDAASFCDGYGWSTWSSPDFPEHSYTVCWEWYYP